jgi:hypothetical protein
VDLDGIKRIDTLEPIAIKLEHTHIKVGIVGEGVVDFVLLDISVHRLGNVAEVVHHTSATFEAAHIQLSLGGVIGGYEKHRIMPNLLNNIILFADDLCGVGVVNHITDIISKRLFEVCGFGVKDHNVHK